MLTGAVIAFFKYKVVRSIIVLACWQPIQQVDYVRVLNQHGFSGTVVCSPPTVLTTYSKHGVQGVLYIQHHDDAGLGNVPRALFSPQYIWLVVAGDPPRELSGARYDADVTWLQTARNTNQTEGCFSLFDVYVHPGGGVSAHGWGSFSPGGGLRVVADQERPRRRQDFAGYPLRIAAPIGPYSSSEYPGPYQQFVMDDSVPVVDAGIRSGYAASSMIIQRLNATEEVVLVELWGSTVHESSMQLVLARAAADLSGGVLRMLPDRLRIMDYLIPIRPFNVGFTFLSERESSSNMFVAPFSRGVWLAGLATAALLAAALRVTSRGPHETNGAYTAVLATFLQQDAGAVPGGAAGRVTFTVVSMCAMLLHAYYTSAVVSALMSAAAGGPRSLRQLADSGYSIASQDIEYMRYLFFDVETNWEDLEYLKKKKKTNKFYQPLERGVELVRAGGTAFHTEYNQLYPLLRAFTDEQICKIQHVDTVPEVMSWITTTRGGQYTGVLRAAGLWLLETGVVRRVVTRVRAPRPACRAQLLAERVTLGDIGSLLAVCCAGAALAGTLLALEMLVARYNDRKTRNPPDEELDGTEDIKRYNNKI